MFLYGVLLAQLYRAMRRNPTSLNVILYSWTLQLGLFGLFATLVPYLTSLWVPVLWLLLSPVMKQKQQAEESSRATHPLPSYGYR
jgi:hypothetical protein